MKRYRIVDVFSGTDAGRALNMRQDLTGLAAQPPLALFVEAIRTFFDRIVFLENGGDRRQDGRSRRRDKKSRECAMIEMKPFDERPVPDDREEDFLLNGDVAKQPFPEFVIVSVSQRRVEPRMIGG